MNENFIKIRLQNIWESKIIILLKTKSVIYFNVFSKEKKFCKSKAAEGPAVTEATGRGNKLGSSELQ